MKRYLKKISLSVLILMFPFFGLYASTTGSDCSEKIKSIYTEYYNIMNSPNSIEKTSILSTFLDKYFTPEFANTQKEEIADGAGADFIAMEYIDGLKPETLKVSKMSDYHLVSFFALQPQPNGNTINKKVYLQVYLKNGLISDVKERK